MEQIEISTSLPFSKCQPIQPKLDPYPSILGVKRGAESVQKWLIYGHLQGSPNQVTWATKSPSRL